MAIKKYLTCKTYLETRGETEIVARLDSDTRTNKLVTEPGDTYTTSDPLGVKLTLKLTSDRHYLVGEIADRLYAYEQLGYEPDELKGIITKYRAMENAKKLALNSVYGKDGLNAESLYPKHIYVTTGRSHGKTEFQRQVYEYLMNDIAVTKEMDDYCKACANISMGDFKLKKNTSWPSVSTVIANVIFNDPATIVFWADGTKTVVKAQDEAFDPEKGLAMAISKKVFGNEGNYFNRIKKWTDKYEEPKIDIEKLLASKCVTVTDDEELPWKIWVEYYEDGEPYAYAVLPREYKRKSSAVRAAHRQYDYRPNVKWTVSQTNPWREENNNGH